MDSAGTVSELRQAYSSFDELDHRGHWLGTAPASLLREETQATQQASSLLDLHVLVQWHYHACILARLYLAIESIECCIFYVRNLIVAVFMGMDFMQIKLNSAVLAMVAEAGKVDILRGTCPAPSCHLFESFGASFVGPGG